MNLYYRDILLFILFKKKEVIIMDIIKYYGSDETKTEFINHDSEPLMAVIAHDRSHAVVSLLDEGCEHHLLLAKALDKYNIDRKSTRLNSSHWNKSRMPSSA